MQKHIMKVFQIPFHSTHIRFSSCYVFSDVWGQLYSEGSSGERWYKTIRGHSNNGVSFVSLFDQTQGGLPPLHGYSVASHPSMLAVTWINLIAVYFYFKQQTILCCFGLAADRVNTIHIRSWPKRPHLQSCRVFLGLYAWFVGQRMFE